MNTKMKQNMKISHWNYNLLLQYLAGEPFTNPRKNADFKCKKEKITAVIVVLIKIQMKIFD